MLSAVLISLILSSTASAQLANTFAVVGTTGVSAQQLFLGNSAKVYIVDKTENNPVTVGSPAHPAWATEYDLASNTFRSQHIKTNTFCAGGIQMGNGSWLNVGGNNAVAQLGISNSVLNLAEGGGPYKDFSGGRATRMLTPCTTGVCNWSEDVDGIPINRWYPTLETLEDGSAIIIGGELYGGFVNSVDQKQSNPTYEFWPTKGVPITSPFLQVTQPANLYPLTWLMPNGQLFIQANWQTTLINYKTGVETPLPNITYAQKTYPASGATAMLPLTVENNFQPTVLFCGGMDPVRDDWNEKLWAIADTATSASCVSMSPMEASPTWTNEDDLPENRGMGNFIQLPDQRLLLVNGVGKGSAGYGYNIPWAINQSFAQDPVTRPAYYNHSAPAGSRFDYDLPSSTVGRLYHSSATLLVDGSVFIAGSNPNSDVITEANNATYAYKTEYRSEIFYPSYFDSPRPVPTGIPKSLSYGGAPFKLQLPASSLTGANLDSVKVALIRTGFSTHAIQMGMRYLQLKNSYLGNADGSATLVVSQVPPNAALLTPGPAILFVVVNGIPSIGAFTMVGTGNIEKQPMSLASVLPASLNLASNSTSPVTASGTPGGATVAAGASASSNTVTAAAAAARSRATRSQRNTATLMSIAGFFTLATLLR